MTYMIKPNFKELAKFVGKDFQKVVKAIKELNEDQPFAKAIRESREEDTLLVCGYELDSTMYTVVEDKLAEAAKVALSKTLEHQTDSDMYKKGWENGKEATLSDAKHVAEVANAAQLEESYRKGWENGRIEGQTSNWINVEDREPELEKEVIVNAPHFGVVQAHLLSDGTWFAPDGKVGEVTHWIPMPAPPKNNQKN